MFYNNYLLQRIIHFIVLLTVVNNIYMLKECGEVDPAFVRKFNHELPRKWKIMNYSYMHIDVSFNKDDNYPLMTYGWNEMKDFWDFNERQILHFSYFGDGLFAMRVSTYHNDNEIPKFHSRHVIGHTLPLFPIRLSEEIIGRPYLVN
jgi:hypothetical protein